MGRLRDLTDSPVGRFILIRFPVTATLTLVSVPSARVRQFSRASGCAAPRRRNRHTPSLRLVARDEADTVDTVRTLVTELDFEPVAADRSVAVRLEHRVVLDSSQPNRGPATLASTLVGWLRRHRLAGFFLLTFALSWGVPVAFLLAAPLLPVAVSVSGYSPLAFLAVWSPAIAAFAVVGLTDGWTGNGRTRTA